MKYRKKPVVIEAWQFVSSKAPHSPWLADAIVAGEAWWHRGRALPVQTGDIRRHLRPGRAFP